MLAPIKAVWIVGFGLSGVSVVAFVSGIMAASFVDAISPILGGLVAAAGAWLTWRQRRSENKIKSVDQEQRGLNDLVNQLQEQGKEDSAQLKLLRRDYSKIYRAFLVYQRGTMILIGQLERNDIEPEWTVPPDAELALSEP